MPPHPRARAQALAALVTGVVAAASAIIAAPPVHAYQYSEVCIVNLTAGPVRANFFKRASGLSIDKKKFVSQGGQECQRDSRTDGPDVSVSLSVGGVFFVNNPAVGWPVIVGRLQSSSSCSWDTYTSTCWYARLGQNQHRCLQENGYWLRPSREADSRGAKQFRIQIYDGSADLSSFGC